LIGTKLFSTTNRLFIGLFGILMLPLLTLAIVAYILAFLAGTPYDIDCIQEPVAVSLLYKNKIITAGLIPSSNAIGVHFSPIRSSSFYNLRRYISILRLANHWQSSLHASIVVGFS
jgi:hypothetical protein